MNGWTGKILDVDLTAGAVSVRDALPLVREYIGGRALAARIGWAEIPPGTDAFDAANRIIVATGPLTGTLAPTSGRTVMATVSPRIYPKPWYTHSTLGGWFGPELKYAGYDAVVIHGCSARPVCLTITDGDARLTDAGRLWGKDTHETQLALKQELGSRCQVLAIGPAGENRIRFSTVQHAEENAAGHSGFGAVWGSKRLKAIAVRGTGGVGVAEPAALLRELEALRFRKAPSHWGARQRPNAARPARPVCSQSCTFNCWAGRINELPDGRRTTCFCIAPVVLNKRGIVDTSYEGGGLSIPNVPCFGPEQEAGWLDLCNRLGLDLWFRLIMLPWLVKGRQLGVDQIRGHTFELDSFDWLETFTRQLADRQGLGALFAEGLVRAMDALENELPAELVRTGRELEYAFGFPSHRDGRFWDSASLPFWVISAMMYLSETRDPTIGSHQTIMSNEAFLRHDPERTPARFRKLAQKVWGDPDALEPSFENKAPVAVWSQHQHMLIDSLTLCDFAFPQLIRPIENSEEWLAADDIAGDLDAGRRLFCAVTGTEVTAGELDRIAERAFTLERAMLARAGRGRALEEGLAAHFALPCRTDGTSIDAAGFARLIDEYYAERGWDLAYGWPTREKLEALGLEALGPELDEARTRFAEVAVHRTGPTTEGSA